MATTKHGNLHLQVHTAGGPIHPWAASVLNVFEHTCVAARCRGEVWDGDLWACGPAWQCPWIRRAAVRQPGMSSMKGAERPSDTLRHLCAKPFAACRGETPEERLEEARAAGDAAQVVLLQKHLARALHSSQLTQVRMKALASQWIPTRVTCCVSFRRCSRRSCCVALPSRARMCTSFSCIATLSTKEATMTTYLCPCDSQA